MVSGSQDLKRAMEIESTQQIQPAVLSKILEDISSVDPTVQSVSLLAVHRIVFNSDCPHACAAFEVLIASGLLPKCLNLLKSETNPVTLNAAVCILLSIASRDFAKNRAVVNSGAVEPLISLLSSPHDNVAEKALWTLTNIIEYRSQFHRVIDKGFILPLVALVETRTDPRILDHASRAFLKIFQVKDPGPGLSALLVRQCLPALARLISHEDLQILRNVSASVYHISRTQEGIQEIVNLGLVAKLVALIGSKAPYIDSMTLSEKPSKDCTIVTNGLWTLANIISGNNSQIQIIIDAGMLYYLPGILRITFENKIIQGAALIVAHIAGGTVAQRQVILDSGLIQGVLGILDFLNANQAVKTAACLAIRNVACLGDIHQLTFLLYQGSFVPKLLSIINRRDTEATALILEAMEGILKGLHEVGQAESLVRNIEQWGGYDKIEQLQVHEDQTINSRAYNLLDTYFDRNVADARNLQPAQEMDTNELYHMNISIQ